MEDCRSVLILLPSFSYHPKSRNTRVAQVTPVTRSGWKPMGLRGYSSALCVGNTCTHQLPAPAANALQACYPGGTVSTCCRSLRGQQSNLGLSRSHTGKRTHRSRRWRGTLMNLRPGYQRRGTRTASGRPGSGPRRRHGALSDTFQSRFSL